MAQEQRRGHDPGDQEGGEQSHHDPELGGAHLSASGGQELQEPPAHRLDAGDHPERTALQVGHRQAVVPVREARGQVHGPAKRGLGVVRGVVVEEVHPPGHEAQADRLVVRDVPLGAETPNLPHPEPGALEVACLAGARRLGPQVLERGGRGRAPILGNLGTLGGQRRRCRGGVGLDHHREGQEARDQVHEPPPRDFST